jgi:hypothetical protein
MPLLVVVSKVVVQSRTDAWERPSLPISLRFSMFLAVLFLLGSVELVTACSFSALA